MPAWAAANESQNRNSSESCEPRTAISSLTKPGKTPGRGAYLCKNKACLEKAKKTRKVERSFVQMFPPETYKEMEDALTRKVQELTDDLPESR